MFNKVNHIVYLNILGHTDVVTSPVENQQFHDTAEQCINVPSESINGILCENEEETSSHQLTNDTNTEHRLHKRKRSDSDVDPYETAQKQIKLNNQTNRIVLNDNQIPIDDSLSNCSVNQNQIIDNCDNLINSVVQTNHILPMVLAKSQENADENFDSERPYDELLSITKDKNINEFGHIYMNGHTATKAESISTIEAPEEYKQPEPEHQSEQHPEQLSEQQSEHQPEQQQQQQSEPLQCQSTNELDENIQSHALTPKTNSPFVSLLQNEMQNETQPCDNIDIPADVQSNALNTPFPCDSIVEKSPKTIAPQIDTYNIPTNSAQIPSDYERISDTTQNNLNNISISDSNNAFTECTTDGKKSMNLSMNVANRTTISSSRPPSDTKKLNTHIRIRRQVFLCSACGTYYEKWNLFYHIREVHNKFICLFENCLGIFPNAERLVNHLESKHVHKPYVYEHKDDLLKSLRNQCFLMCCVCEHIFTENDDVTAHLCETFAKPCSVCGLQFIHKSNCSALLSSKSSKHKQKRMPVTSNSTQPALTSAQQSNSINNISQQQTFLRNALLGQEPRINHYTDYQSSPGVAQIPMFDHRLNSLSSHQLHLQTQLQPQPQPQQNVPASVPVPMPMPMPTTSTATINGNTSQQSMVNANANIYKTPIPFPKNKMNMTQVSFLYFTIILTGTKIVHGSQ